MVNIFKISKWFTCFSVGNQMQALIQPNMINILPNINVKVVKNSLKGKVCLGSAVEKSNPRRFINWLKILV